jgi:hypothetical protein
MSAVPAAVIPAAPTPAQNQNALENKFQALWDGGAFESPAKRPEPAQEPPASPPPEPEARAEDSPAEPEPEGPDYSSVEDYLTKAGVEQTSFYELPVTIKVDGKTSQVPLKDLLRSYQTDAHVTQKSQSLADRQREWEQHQTQARQALEQQLSQAKTLGDLAHQQLLGEYQRIDWNRLRTEDPSQWAVLNTEFNQRAAAIQQHMAQVQYQQQLQQQQEVQRIAGELPKEREKLLDLHPEFRDSATFTKAQGDMIAYARDKGFSDAELQALFDHRYVDVLYDASRYRQLQAQAPAAVKRVRAAPQVATPGARTTRDPKQVEYQQAKERFRKNPRDIDAQQAVFDRLAERLG